MTRMPIKKVFIWTLNVVVEVPKVNSSSLCCSSFSNKIETKLSMTINGKNIEKYVGCAFANFGNSSGTEGEPS